MSNPRQSALTVAFPQPVVRRATEYTLAVGVVLAPINHGDCPVNGNFNMDGCLYKSVLTARVPYVVSTRSSVQVILSKENSSGKRGDTDMNSDS